jgi:putative chitinase
MEPTSSPTSKKRKLLTKTQLLQISPKSKNSKLDLSLLVDTLNEHMQKGLVDDTGFASINRKAAFLAQCAHESAQFTAVVENLNYSAESLMRVFPKRFPTLAIANEYAKQPEKIGNSIYANRMGNGPESSGDGFRYRGRGLIQLTGKQNYARCGNAIGVNLVNNPSYLETERGAVESAMWFWNSNGLNTFADKEDIIGMTKRINGGYHGLNDRIALYEKAKAIF